MAAIGPAAIEAQALTPERAAELVDRPTEPDFLACGFVHIGVWGRRPGEDWATGRDTERSRGRARPGR
jgi:hypothetical protein